MAFVREDFKAGDSTGNAPAIHAYISDDTAATVNAANYFLSIYQLLTVGDLIYVAGDQDGTPFYEFRAVSAVSSTSVTTAAAS